MVSVETSSMFQRSRDARATRETAFRLAALGGNESFYREPRNKKKNPRLPTSRPAPNQEKSAGEQQRVATARALANGPRLVLMDEPTGNLDQENSRELMQLVTEMIQGEEATCVVATHNLNIVQEADSKVFLKSGRVVSGWGVNPGVDSPKTSPDLESGTPSKLPP